MTAGLPPFQSADQLQRALQGLGTFQAGQTYTNVRCVVRDSVVKTGQRGPYLEVTLADRTGDVSAKCWDGAKLAATLPPGTVVELARVEVDSFNGRVGAKFEPKAVRVLAPGEYRADEFVASLPTEVIDHHWARLQERLDDIDNPYLQRLRVAVFAEPEVAALYKSHPSAVRWHHNYLGGNVQHVLGITRVLDALTASYPVLDRDLLTFGAVVHDLGKLREYEVTTTIRVTDEGRMRGHLVIGAEWLAQIVQKMRRAGSDFPKPLEEHLVHMILSHHKKGEWGSPKPPATKEAWALHVGDYADSQTKSFLQDAENADAGPDGWAQRWDSDAGAKQWFRPSSEWE